MAILKKYLVLVLTVFLVSLTGWSLNVYGDSPNIVDQAQLFTEQEKQEFQQTINHMKKTFQFDTVILTTTDTQGKSAESYADDFYDYNNFGVGKNHDGVLFLIDMQNRAYHFSTTGNMMAVLTDQRIDQLKDQVSDYLSDGDYSGAVTKGLGTIEAFAEKGEASGVVYHPETDTIEKTKYLSPLKWGVALVILLVSSLLYYFWIKQRYQLKKSSYHYPYIANSQVTITKATHHKTADVVTSRVIPKADPPSGGGTHTGSSGTNHGGGGGTF